MCTMRKENPARYSSAVGEGWMHCMFNIKYYHTIFDDELYHEGMHTLLLEAAYEYEIPLGEIGFDNNHVRTFWQTSDYTADPKLPNCCVATQPRNSLRTFRNSSCQGIREVCSGTVVCGILRTTLAHQKTWRTPSGTYRDRSMVPG